MRKFWVYEGFGFDPDGPEPEDEFAGSDYAVVCVAAGEFGQWEVARKEFQEILSGVGIYVKGNQVRNEDVPAVTDALVKAGWGKSYIPIGP